jgi:hypothetical protein
VKATFVVDESSDHKRCISRSNIHGGGAIFVDKINPSDKINLMIGYVDSKHTNSQVVARRMKNPRSLL